MEVIIWYLLFVVFILYFPRCVFGCLSLAGSVVYSIISYLFQVSIEKSNKTRYVFKEEMVSFDILHCLLMTIRIFQCSQCKRIVADENCILDVDVGDMYIVLSCINLSLKVMNSSYIWM